MISVPVGGNVTRATLLMVTVAIGTTRLVPRTAPATLPPAIQGDARPECPQDSVIKILDGKGKVVRWVNSVSASGPITGIPEFHDCQRFLRKRPWYAFWRPKWSYDSLYAIFAAFRLDTVPDSSLASAEIPVATIYSYGGTYSTLGIAPGFNCLFLTPPKTGTGLWGARMVSVADSNCLDQGTLKPQGTPTTLDVKRFGPAGTVTVNDFPAAARWDWGKLRGGRQHIGIRCGHAWCEVGAPGFTPSNVYAGPAVTFQPVTGVPMMSTAQQQRVTQVKGWYDAQRLDIVVDGKQVPSNLQGVIIPSPWLDVLPRTNVAPGLTIFHNTWVQVAAIWINGGDYKGNLKAGLNEVWICHEKPGTTNLCQVDLTQAPIAPWTQPLTTCYADPDEGGRWWAKIVPPAGVGNKPQFRCVQRRSHLNHLMAYEAAHAPLIVQIPGAARWRWLLDDAGEWTKCETGCCTGQ